MEANGPLHFRVFSLERRAGRVIADSIFTLHASEMEIRRQAVDPVSILVIAVKTELEPRPQQNNNCAGHTNGKSSYINQRIKFVPQDIADSYF